MSKQMSSPHEVVRGNVTTIRSEREGSVMLQCPLFTKSNYASWSVKMHVKLQAQGVWDVVEHGDVEA